MNEADATGPRTGTDRPAAQRQDAETSGRFQVSRDSFERLLINRALVNPDDVAPLIRRARAEGVSLIRLMLANNHVGERDLYGALAAYHDLPFLPAASLELRPTIPPSEIGSCLATGWIRLRDRDGRHVFAAAPENASTTTLRHLGGASARVEPIDAITTPGAIREWIERHYGPLLLEESVSALARARADLSASRRLAPNQAAVLACLAAALAAAFALLPLAGVLAGIYVAASLLFLALAVQRLITFASEIGARRAPPPPLEIGVRDLPVYTVLVPLYREAHMVGEIVSSVLALDYPRSKLDIKLVLEADDDKTLTAAASLNLPGCVDIVVVPAGLPRTKPKALNYALNFARGDFVTVYDAEDMPQPGQLRTALAAFAAGPRTLACMQARLSIRNTGRSWLARQFAIEYASLFNVIMPGLDRLQQPVMLGGTSNHFRLDVLRAIGGWDPYNVTEDADIGIRLSRFGFRAAWLESETIEEAPETLSNWFWQRTRWLRGWIQTYCVHMRHPIRLMRELGVWRALSLQVTLAGVIVSALAHPVFVFHIFAAAVTGAFYATGPTPLHDALLLISAVNLLVGYGVVMEIAVLGLYRERRPDLLISVLAAPLYWLLISAAAYAALVRFVLAPFKWEKTTHLGHNSLAEAPDRRPSGPMARLLSATRLGAKLRPRSPFSGLSRKKR